MAKQGCFLWASPWVKTRTIWQGTSKYDQHAYSSYLGFCLAGDDLPGIGAGRSGYSYDGRKWFYRERATPIQITPDHIVSRYTLKSSDNDSTPDYNRDEMITHTLIGKDGELHIFWHNSPEPLYMYLGGYGLSVTGNHPLTKQQKGDAIWINSGDYYSLMEAVQTPEGQFETTVLTPRPGWSATHLFGGSGAFPYWQSSKGVPPNVPVVFYVNGTRSRKPPIGSIDVKKEGSRLKILFEGEQHLIPLPL